MTPGAEGQTRRVRAGVEPITGAGALLGEGPVWDDTAGVLVWVDIWGGLLHTTDPETGETATRDLGAPLSSVVLSRRGTFVVTAGLCVLEVGDEDVRHIADLPEPRCMRANDAAVDPAGRLWIGTMTMPHRPKRSGGLWRLDPGSDTPVPVLDDVTLANGIAWSPSGDAMYFVDSLRQQLTRYEFDPSNGSVGSGEVLVRIPEEDGMPDGLAVDSGGGIWVAMAGGGTVRRYTPSGTLDQQIALPVAFPTSCAFGGALLGDLFVTTGCRPVDPVNRPAAVAAGAGALFRVATATTGLPADRMVL
jgi:sugar lactone lactonase YvrE